MSERAPECDDDEYGSADYEYDLAHDEAEVPPQQPGPGEQPTVRVDRQTAEAGGDYGYDMAHDGR